MLSSQSESTLSVQRDPAADCQGQFARLPLGGGAVSNLKSFVRRTWEWMSPFRIWREVKLAETARRDFAVGLAIGVFIACVPLYGFQTILGLFAARKFALHPLPILAGSQLSAPPFAPALTVASVVMGHAVISGKLPHWADWHITDWHIAHWPAFSMAAVNSFVVSWLIGGAMLGVLLAGITYVIAFAAMRLMFRRGASGPVA
jgi:uncharacterized protein (DUF2062 family)